MTRLAERELHDEDQRPDWPPGVVIGGVDTHKHVHVAAVCDPLGRMLDSASFPTTMAGFKALLRFLCSHGELAAVGVEGTGCWGGRLARWLTAREVRVIEVDRLQSLADTAPDELRDALIPMRYARLIEMAARFRPGALTTTTAAAKYTMACLARRLQALDAELAGLDQHLEQLIARAAPALLARHGIGPETAAALLCAAGDNPERLSSEGLLRRPVRRLTRAGILGQDQPTPAQPRRRPPGQQRPGGASSWS